MLSYILTSSFMLASFANAHFSIEYPEMRGDSFATGASQYIYPCANVNQTSATNRTIWPLTGGSLNLDLHHQWTYYFVNLGLGTNYPTFNISLTQQLLNETGNGTLCMPHIVLPAGLAISEGQNASIQVVTVGHTGSALYNCADITFSSAATTLSGSSCANSSNVAVSVVSATNATSTTSGAGKSFGLMTTASVAVVLGAGILNWGF
ncbi:hypothetical protein BGZ57DRAFT_887721 [Hyaloscypha finlandica]|uniref:Copper acquisition factor BIM1-like domain-containing protein n=1 Tax=Hyaloscypha finlandica TaxID=2482753 RepID=C3VER8_9HELO|nr:secreted hypothetical protein [Hyaloscypha finlandica]KAH8775958.1 hypothetical protein F5882DRAFT_408831 [Hyaloscypha sp. PMI_1271]KAH8781701.1 hypothetical protein BGZ57DRAFT_887721 [Hyaloscypha finlandica]